MHKRFIYLVAGCLFSSLFALPYIAPGLVSAQEKLELEPLPGEEEIDLDSLSLPGEETEEKKKEDSSVPPLPGTETKPKAEPAPTTPATSKPATTTAPSTTTAPELPLAPFEPAPEAKTEAPQVEEKDTELENLLLGITKEEIESETAEPGTPIESAKPEVVEEIKPRFKWWEKENPYKKQMLPEVIYKKDYDDKNRHLPQAYDLTDLDRWLFKTAEDGDVNGTRALLNKNIDPDPRNVYGNTPLIGAALNCRTDTVRLLLARGANPNVQNKLGLSALHIGSYKGCIDIVKALLQMGANPNLKNNQGFTPIEFAATNKHYAVAQVLLDNGAARTSRFFSGMIHERSITDVLNHSKYPRKKDLPQQLPEQTSGSPDGSKDENEDSEILEKALGVTPEEAAESGAAGEAGSGSNAAGQTGADTMGPNSAGAEGTEGAAPGTSTTEDNGVWRQTKGGSWNKIGGSEPPQGVAGIYWHQVDNVWYPLDPNEPAEAGKIEELKKKLGHTSSTPTVPQMPSSPPASMNKKDPANETISTLPAEVIEDLKPTTGDVTGAPSQGVGGVWWHQVDGEWQPLDPEIPSEAKQIEQLKSIYGVPATHVEEGKPDAVKAPAEQSADKKTAAPDAKKDESKAAKDKPADKPATTPELKPVPPAPAPAKADEKKSEPPAAKKNETKTETKPDLKNTPPATPPAPPINIEKAIVPPADTKPIPVVPKKSNNAPASADGFEPLPDIPDVPMPLPGEEEPLSLEDLELPPVTEMDAPATTTTPATKSTTTTPSTAPTGTKPPAKKKPEDEKKDAAPGLPKLPGLE